VNFKTMELLNAKQVAKMLNCSIPLIYKMADKGQLPCVRWDCWGCGTEKERKTVRFKQEDVMDFIEKHSVTT